MANCLVSAKKYKAALAWIERGIKIKETSQIFYLAGVSWKNMQEPERAQSALRRSVALDANNAAAKNLLAEIDATLVGPNQVDTPAPELIVITQSENFGLGRRLLSPTEPTAMSFWLHLKRIFFLHGQRHDK